MEASAAASVAPIATATIINVEEISSMAASSGGNTHSNCAGTGRGRGKGGRRNNRNGNKEDLSSTSRPYNMV